MAKEKFRVTGKITRLLGRESVSDKATALHEVLKNSHDADALSVDISFEDFDVGHGKIVIKEIKGDGMTYDDIKNKFLVIGTYSKQPKDIKSQKDKKSKTSKNTSNKKDSKVEQKITDDSNQEEKIRRTDRLDRIMVGRKGVGRFALEKLGNKVSVISKPFDSTKQLSFEIDWKRFEDKKVTIDDVLIDIIPSRRKNKEDSGLEIVISELRDYWDKESISDFMNSLKKLILPKQLQGKKPFKIFMSASYFGIKKQEIESKLKDNDFYHLEAELTDNKITVVTTKLGKEYFSDTIEDFTSTITNRDRKVSDLSCGPVKLVISYFPTYLKSDSLRKWYYDASINRYGEDLFGLIPETMKDNHGVRIIKDGIREFKYGDSGYDWTERAKISRNYSGTVQADRLIGFCLISGETNPEIIPTTNRTEAIDNQAFEDLKDFVITSMLRLDREINKDRKSLLKDFHEKVKPTVDNLKLLQRALKNPQVIPLIEQLESTMAGTLGKEFYFIPTIQSALKAVTSKQEEYEEIVTKDEITLSNSLLGEYFIKHYHERVEPVKDTTQHDIQALDDFRRRKEMKKESELQKISDNLNESWEMLRVTFDVIDAGIKGLSVEDFIKKDKVKVSLKQEFDNAFAGLTKLFEFDDVKLDNEVNEHLELEVFGPILHSLLYNLLSNSLKSFDDQPKKDPNGNTIRITTKIDNGVILQFSDNSTEGIPKNRWKLVFEEHISTTGKRKKLPGHGLGLSILKRMLENIKGEIEITPPHFQNGTTFEIRIPEEFIAKD